MSDHSTQCSIKSEDSNDWVVGYDQAVKSQDVLRRVRVFHTKRL